MQTYTGEEAIRRAGVRDAVSGAGEGEVLVLCVVGDGHLVL